MTSAPKNILAVRALLLKHLDIHENSSAYSTDLDPAEVGIVGDAAHRGGYHCGRDRVDLDDYSVDESPRDLAGLGDYSSALDVGSFTYRDALGRVHNLATFSKWLVVECEANAPDTRDIREVIYSPDGTSVKRWDRLRKRSSGDSSHRWHTHISFFRDATKAGRDLTGVFRRYLEQIGLIEMPLTLADRVGIWAHDLKNGDGVDPAYVVLNRAASEATAAKAGVTALRADVAAVKTAVAKLSAPAPVVVDPATLAAALASPAFLTALAKAVNDDAARRLAA